MSKSKTAEHEFEIATREVAAKYAAKRAATIFEFVVFCFKKTSRVEYRTNGNLKSTWLSLATILKMCQDQSRNITTFDDETEENVRKAKFKQSKFDAGFPLYSEAELSTVLDRLCELGRIKKHNNQDYKWVGNYYGCDFYPST